MAKELEKLKALRDLVFRSPGTRVRPKTLLIIRIDVVGDYLLFRNFISEIAKAYQGYEVTFCGNTLVKDLAEKFDSRIVDHFIWIDRKMLISNSEYRKNTLASICRKYSYETVVNPTFSRNILGDFLVRAFSAKEKIGSIGNLANISPLAKIVTDRFYTRLVPVSPGTMFEFYRNKEFTEGVIGHPINIKKPELDVSGVKFETGFEKGSYVVLFPGAGEKLRKWVPENFAKVADFLSEKYRLGVTVAGSPQDTLLAKEIIRKTKANAIDLTGKITLPQLGRTIADSALLISNETMAVHLAVSVGKKSVCISNRNYYGRYCPYPKELSAGAYAVFTDDPTGKFNSSCKNSRVDVNSVPVERVVDIIDAIL